MRVIQINCVYKSGSTGKIVYDLHEEFLSRSVDSYVIYGRGEGVVDDRVYKCASEVGSKARNLISRFNGNLYGMGANGTRNIIKHIKYIKPDVVHLHCINGYFCDIYSLLEYLKKEGVPTVLTLHAEFMYTGNCGYAFDCDQWKDGCKKCDNPKMSIGSSRKKATHSNWIKMQKAFEGFNNNLIIAGVSQWISDRAAQSVILKDKKICTVLNGLNNAAFCYREDNVDSDIKRFQNEGKNVILYVTPYFEDQNKGGSWVLRLADLFAEESVQFVVVGNKEKEYNIPNITFIGRVNSQEKLASLYSAADLCLLTSKRETFSMVCAEALCCGTPIVGFEAGAPEQIAIKEYSEFVPYGDIDGLSNVIRKWIDKKIDKRQLSVQAIDTYCKKTMADKYLELYESLLRN